jgi:hypothetical protein
MCEKEEEGMEYILEESKEINRKEKIKYIREGKKQDLKVIKNIERIVEKIKLLIGEINVREFEK